MYENRDIKSELEKLEIIDIEGVGGLSRNAVFAAIDAVKIHDEKYPLENMAKQMEDIRRKTLKNLSVAKLTDI